MRHRNQWTRHLLALALVFAIAAAGMACSGGGGSSEIEDVCEAFCEASTTCTDIPDAQSLCEDECVDDFDRAENLDGDECVDEQLAAMVCAEQLACPDLNKFNSLTFRQSSDVVELFLGRKLCDLSVVDCCEEELLKNIVKCPDSFALD